MIVQLSFLIEKMANVRLNNKMLITHISDIINIKR